ncbi:MAG: protein kinase domain-containing protein [Pseudonocardiaceae bacterium]
MSEAPTQYAGGCVVISEGELLAERYRLVTQIGIGAMGVVWKAHDEHLDRIVAVKQLLWQPGTSDSEAEEADRRAMREARITARLDHPHAVAVYNVAEHDGTPCLIMEYLHSESLSTVLDERGPLRPAQVARIGTQIAAALAAAHEAGIVHRDIKPGNVLLAPDGTAKITDFGISQAVGDGTMTATGILVGTPAYLAPEVARGQPAGFAADVFSLGATLYAAVEGVPPFGFDDNHLALVFRITHSDMTPPTKAGPLTPVLARLLERDPGRRLTMAQAQEVLTETASAHPGVVVPTALAVSPDPPASVTTSDPATVEVPLLPVTDPSYTAAPPPSTDAPTPRVAPAEVIPALWSRTEAVPPPRRSTAVTVGAAALLFIVGLLVVTLLNGRSSTEGRGAGSPSTPASGQNQQAPQRPPNSGGTAWPAPILAPTPEPPLVPEPPESTPEPPVPEPPVPTPEPTPVPTAGPPVPTPEPTMPTPEPTMPTPVPTPEPLVPTPVPTVPTPEPPEPTLLLPVPIPDLPVPIPGLPVPPPGPSSTPDAAHRRPTPEQLQPPAHNEPPTYTGSAGTAG